jgi:hypothetical protein
VLALALALGVLVPAVVRPDALVITRAMTATTIAEIFVEDDHVRLELEIGLPDLAAFPSLLPDPLYERLGHEPESLERRLPRFFTEDFVIRPDGGAPLLGRIEEIEARPRVQRDDVTGEPLPVADEEKAELVVFARIVYPLEGRPKSMAVGLPHSAEGPSASIGFVLYHRGLPVNDFRYLGREEIVRFDWDDPWFSKFDNRNLWRQYDVPVSAFLYVEPFEVRKEIVLRPRDLQPWVDLGLDGKDVITVAEQPEIKRRVVEFLAGKNPVTIDGQLAEGRLDRVHFIYRNLRTSGVINPPRDLDAVSATLGVIFYYPVDGLPQEVAMEWELFSEKLAYIPAAATDEAGPLPYRLQPDDPILRWQNFLKNPTMPGLVDIEEPPLLGRVWLALGSLLCGIGIAWIAARYGRPALRGQRPSWRAVTLALVLLALGGLSLARAVRPIWASDENADEVVLALLENVYRSFDYRDESLIYDSLERSVTGELLTETYLETRRSLELENQGGARAKVKSVEMEECTHAPLTGAVGLESLCSWSVSGSVGHWGHVHQRTNQYEARLSVRAVDGRWKITALDLLQEQRSR